MVNAWTRERNKDRSGNRHVGRAWGREEIRPKFEGIKNEKQSKEKCCGKW